MLIIHVSIHVKPEFIEAFKTAILDNASNSVREPGVVRFDVVQQADDPSRFMLLEAYHTTEAHAAHRETAHYQRWRDAVGPMMAETRTSVKYTHIFPEAAAW
jgi:quinol monooxygenase YgiN